MGFAKNFVATLLGFLLVLLVREAIVPHARGPLEIRTSPLLAARKSCTVLFVGPSYVDDQIYTEVFDAEARRIGLPARACKFGAPSFKSYELKQWLEHALSYDWPKLELVVIDITLGDEVGFEEKNWFKPRVVEWHTWSAIPWLVDHYRGRADLTKDEQNSLLWVHLKHVAMHYAKVGEGVRTLGALHLLERFRPAESSDEAKPKRRRVPRSQRANRTRGADHDRHVANLESKKRTRRNRLENSDWPLELRNLVRKHDKEAYFLIAPVLYFRGLPDRSVQGNDRLVVMDFSDPRRYPELYREEVRGNTSHLRGEGRPLYSELLAQKLQSTKHFRR